MTVADEGVDHRPAAGMPGHVDPVGVDAVGVLQLIDDREQIADVVRGLAVEYVGVPFVAGELVPLATTMP